MAVQNSIKATIVGLLLLPITSFSFSRSPSASFVSIPRSRYLTTNTLAASREALQGEHFIARNGTSDVLTYQNVGSGLQTEDDDDETTFLERELLEGYMAHQQYLLDATDEIIVSHHADEESVTFYEEPQVLTTSSYTTTASTDSVRNHLPKSFILSDVWKARMLLLLSAALYGTNFSVVKQLDEIIPVGVSSTLRFGLAAFAMLPLLIAPLSEEFKNNVKNTASKTTTYAFLEPSRLSVGLAGMEIGLWNSIGYISQAIGLRTTAASTSAFICSMAVVTVPMLDYIFGRPLLRRQIVGAALAAFGVYALEMGQDVSSFTSDDMASLVQPIMFGLGFWRMEAAMEKFPTEAARLASGQLFMVFLVSLSYLVCWSPAGDDLMIQDACNVIPTMGDIAAWLSDPSILGMLIWTGLITTAFTIYMETLALKTLSAAETTLIFSTEPLFGAAFAAVVANECLSEGGYIGSALIIGGCVISGIDWSQHFRRRGGIQESN
mmetsp:Transcript_25053/g.37913  ORF Transcript_25053/g.37913 Transcript_25053/m.37913 type:complete len:494 (+) Transcript_25053:68-1549(+)